MEASIHERAEKLAIDVAAQAKTIGDIQGIIRNFAKSALERILNSEMNEHLNSTRYTTMLPSSESAETPPADAEQTASTNRRNGHSKKTVQGDFGKIILDIPRDRESTFEPIIIPKHQRRLTGFDEKILALYAKGMTTRDIQDVVKQLYGVEVSPTLISQITADLDEEVTAWRHRKLEAIWPIVYFDGIVVHVRGSDGRVTEKTMYVALGVNLEGKKELLGLWINDTEGAKFWLACLTDLKNRGLKDIFIVCIDGLSGFPEAIRVAYPEAKVQLCIVHLVRAALKYVTDKDSAQVIVDLKKIYQASSAAEAEEALKKFAEVWDAKYPTISKMWHAKWKDIIAMFEFPDPLRKAIYTTNAIESVNSVIRKYTRNRKMYPNEESALKLIYLAIHEASKKWTMPIVNWKQALNHFAIMFEGRMPKNNWK